MKNPGQNLAKTRQKQPKKPKKPKTNWLKDLRLVTCTRAKARHLYHEELNTL
jgi:hypothetical protein